MIIEFKSVLIHNFMSIGEADVTLADQGMVLVKGINQYESKLDSNGSGKSAIFESIVWCLTGQTTRGAKEVANMYSTDKSSYVIVSFNLNKNIYKVIRRQKPSKSLEIHQDHEDISGATYTKTKDILNSILGDLTYDRLISIIFLSQGLPGRFSELSPSLRKSRLEALSHTSEILPKLIEQVDQKYQKANSEYSQLNMDISRLEGSIRSHKYTIENTQKTMNELSSESKEDLLHQIDLLNINLEESSRILKGIEDQVSILEGSREQYTKFQRSAEWTRDSLKKQIQQIKDNIKAFQVGKCPTCGATRNFDKEIEDQLSQLSDLTDKLTSIELDIDSITDVLEGVNPELEELAKKRNELFADIQSKNQDINNISTRLKLLETVDLQLQDLTQKLESDEQDLKIKKADIIKLDKQLVIISYFKNNLNKKFRTYLINSVVDFMNQKLIEISKYLYKVQGSVRLECNGNNIDIYLGDRDISTLSGGELRRVDLILQLAQRSLCEYYSGFSCNLLVLDEVLDYLDTQGVENVLAMMEVKSVDVSSTMIVTHRPDLDLAFDHEITVIKDESQISRVIQ